MKKSLERTTKKTTETRKVSSDFGEITYTLTRKNVKNINLRIKADSTVSVSANPRVATVIIDGFIAEKAEFIANSLAKFAERKQLSPKENQYITDETFMLLGAPLQLKVIKSHKNQIVHDGDLICLYTKDTEDLGAKKRVMDKWISQKCEAVFSQIAGEIHPRFQGFGVDYPVIKARIMTARWGSCRPIQGIITLNKALIHLPIKAIEYVVVHEFCHFIHPNHSKAFYKFMEEMLPDWKERKTLL